MTAEFLEIIIELVNGKPAEHSCMYSVCTSSFAVVSQEQSRGYCCGRSPIPPQLAILMLSSSYLMASGRELLAVTDTALQSLFAGGVILQGGSRLVLSIHIDQVLFLPTTNWLTNILSIDDMFVSQFVVGRKRT